MIKNRLITSLFFLMILLYTSCSEKEVPKPTVDTARLDALRQELRDLQLKVYGEELKNGQLTADQTDLNATVDAYEAAIADLQATYAKAVTYQVQVFDFQGKVIPGASVTVNQDGAITAVTAGSDGVAKFENVRAGAVVGVVSATGFATANYMASLYNASNFGSVTNVALIPVGGSAQADAGMFTISGYVYANMNAVDDTTNTINGFHNYYLGGPSGPITGGTTRDPAFKFAGPNESAPHRTYTKMNKGFIATLYLDISYVPFSFDDNYGCCGPSNAAVRRMAYENAVFTATYDVNNKYSLKLPAFSDFVAGLWGSTGSTQWYYEYFFEEFTADATLIDFTTVGTYSDYQVETNNTNIVWQTLSDTKPVSGTGVLKTITRKYEYRINQDDNFNSTYWSSWDFNNNDQQVQPGQKIEASWTNFFYLPYKNF